MTTERPVIVEAVAGRGKASKVARQLISIQKATNRIQGIYERYPDLAYSGDRIHQGLHQ